MPATEYFYTGSFVKDGEKQIIPGNRCFYLRLNIDRGVDDKSISPTEVKQAKGKYEKAKEELEKLEKLARGFEDITENTSSSLENIRSILREFDRGAGTVIVCATYKELEDLLAGRVGRLYHGGINGGNIREEVELK